MRKSPSTWILRGARLAFGPVSATSQELAIRAGLIEDWGRPPALKPPTNSLALELDGHLVLPGLINAHDHLEFNLFPRLGRGPYPNAGEWARDVYRPRESPIREHRRVPTQLISQL